MTVRRPSLPPSLPPLFPPAGADKVAFALELYEAGRPIQDQDQDQDEDEDEDEGGREGPIETRRRRNKKRKEEEEERGEVWKEEEEEEEEEEGALYSPADVRMMLRSMNNVREGGREGRKG